VPENKKREVEAEVEWFDWITLQNPFSNSIFKDFLLFLNESNSPSGIEKVPQRRFCKGGTRHQRPYFKVQVNISSLH